MRNALLILFLTVVFATAQTTNQFTGQQTKTGDQQSNVITGGGGGGGGTFTFLTNAIAFNTGTSTATTPARDTTGAQLIDLFTASVGAVTVADLKGNTLTAATAETVGGLIVQHYYVCSPGSVGSGHQFSVTGSFIMIGMECWSYTGGTPVKDNENGATSAVTASIQTGAISSTGGGRVVISGITMSDTGNTFSVDSSMKISDQARNGASNIGLAMAHLEQSSGASVNPTWTILGGAENNVAAASIAFK